MVYRTGYGPFFTQGWVCTSAAINHTTAHMHWHHEATSGLSWPGLRRNLRALRLYVTASVRRGTVSELCHKDAR